MIIRRNEIHNLNFSGKTVGLTSGCFDMLHFYHLRYLERCKAQCDFLIVGVDSDALVFKNKNKIPMITEHHRLAMVDALKCVDAVFQMDEIKDLENFYPCVNKVFKNSPVIYGNEVEIKNSQAELVIIPDIEEVYSTSELIEKIRNFKDKKIEEDEQSEETQETEEKEDWREESIRRMGCLYEDDDDKYSNKEVVFDDNEFSQDSELETKPTIGYLQKSRINPCDERTTVSQRYCDYFDSGESKKDNETEQETDRTKEIYSLNEEHNHRPYLCKDNL